MVTPLEVTKVEVILSMEVRSVQALVLELELELAVAVVVEMVESQAPECQG